MVCGRYYRHNSAVRAYFAGRPDDLLELCMDTLSDTEKMAALERFLGCPEGTGGEYMMLNARKPDDPKANKPSRFHDYFSESDMQFLYVR